MAKIVDNSNKPALRRQEKLLQNLIVDHSRPNHHIVWASSRYNRIPKQEINLIDLDVIQPDARNGDGGIRTPRSIIAQMNQRVDYESSHWPARRDNWQDYVADQKLEICCGEVPFIVDRYDADFNLIPAPERHGFLDRKLQVVSRFCSQADDWLKWTLIAYQSCYGYELCGDRLFLARENLLYTFVDFWNFYFPEQTIDLKRKLSPAQLAMLQELTNIISWNLFQMDGLTGCVPYTEPKIPAQITDWQTGEVIKFANLYKPEATTLAPR